MLALVRHIFTWSIENEILTSNPAKGIKAKKEGERDRTLTREEIRIVWKADVPYWKMILIMMQRMSDVQDMKWSQIADGEWKIPASQFKTRTTHIVPLSSLAIEVLESIPRLDGQDYVFRDRERVAKKKLPVDAIRKDLQRTTRSMMSGIGVSPDTAERVQGHKITGTRSKYDRYDYNPANKTALERWAEELQRILPTRSEEPDRSESLDHYTRGP